MPNNEQENAPNTTQTTITNVGWPTFDPINPSIFFLKLNYIFETYKMDNSRDKFSAAITHIPDHLFPLAFESILKDASRQDDPYIFLKDKILSLSQTNESQRWDALLSLPPMGDMTPIKFLELLRHKSPTNTHDNEPFLKQLLIKNLPEYVRMILSVNTYDNLDALATAATTIMAVREPTNKFPSVSKVEFKPDPHHNNISDLRDSILSLERTFNLKMKDLTERLSYLETQQHMDRSRNRSNSGQRSFRQPNHYNQSRPHQDSNTTLCYKHQRFGIQARGCVQPCSWISNRTHTHTTPPIVTNLNSNGTQNR
jgi:hypothetical protein